MQLGNTKKQIKVGKGKAARRRLELRNKLWPNIDDSKLWHASKDKGFTPIPRVLPHAALIMDEMSNGKPLSSTYSALWCRVFDESFVVVASQSQLAFEAGFSGQRSEATWRSRMKILVENGFIEAKPGPAGPFHYVLILNPIVVIEEVKDRISSGLFNAFVERALEVGAYDDE